MQRGANKIWQIGQTQMEFLPEIGIHRRQRNILNTPNFEMKNFPNLQKYPYVDCWEFMDNYEHNGQFGHSTN